MKWIVHLGALVLANVCVPPSTASARRPASGQVRLDTGAIVIEGLRTEGDVPMRFEKVVDLRSGHSRTIQHEGP